jgi:hypothetical protein
MSLWLKAWDITPVLNPPRKPQSNAKVERAQGTSSRWAELHKAQNLEDLQLRLTQALRDQRETFPVKRLGQVSRASLFHKELYALERPYKEESFEIHRALSFLAQTLFIRKVDSQGTANNYGKDFQVGVSHKRQTVLFQFNVEKNVWEVSSRKQELLKSFPDKRFCRQMLLDLSICQLTFDLGIHAVGQKVASILNSNIEATFRRNPIPSFC